MAHLPQAQFDTVRSPLAASRRRASSSMAGEWSTPITCAAACCQFGQQAAGADADLQHGDCLPGPAPAGAGGTPAPAGASWPGRPTGGHGGRRTPGCAGGAPPARPPRQPGPAALRQQLQLRFEGRADGRKEAVPVAGPVVAPGPLAFDGQHTGLGQDLEMARDARLPHADDAGQFLHGEFTAQQDRNQAQAAGVGQGFESSSMIYPFCQLY